MIEVVMAFILGELAMDDIDGIVLKLDELE